MNKYIKDAENAINEALEETCGDNLKKGKPKRKSKIIDRFYLARDKDGSLSIFTKKPFRNEEDEIFDTPGFFDAIFIPESEHIGKGITWENSPIEYQRVIKDTEE